MERYVDQFDFPCSSTFRDYYNFIAIDGDHKTTLSREQMIEQRLIYPIENEPEFRKHEKLGFADSRELRASINALENKLNTHTHSRKTKAQDDGY